MSEEQIDARIKANEEAGDDAVATEAARIWRESLVDLKAANDAVLGEKKVREELAKLEKLPVLTLPPEIPADAPLADQEANLKKVVSLIKENEDFIQEIEDIPEGAADLISEESKIKSELKELEIPTVSSSELDSAKHQKAVQTKRRLEAKLKEIQARIDLRTRQGEVRNERILSRNTYGVGLQNLQKKLFFSHCLFTLRGYFI